MYSFRKDDPFSDKQPTGVSSGLPEGNIADVESCKHLGVPITTTVKYLHRQLSEW